MKNNILGRRVGQILTGARNSIQLSFCFNFNISIVCMDTVHLVGAVSFEFYISSELFFHFIVHKFKLFGYFVKVLGFDLFHGLSRDVGCFNFPLILIMSSGSHTC